MKHSKTDRQELVTQLDPVNMVAYKRSIDFQRSFSSDETTIFALLDNSSRETIVTINNQVNRIEAVRMTSNGNILDAVGAVFRSAARRFLRRGSPWHQWRSSSRIINQLPGLDAH